MNNSQIAIVINLIELIGLLYIFISVRMLQKHKNFYLKSWEKAEEENMELKERIESLESIITSLTIKEVDYSDFDETKWYIRRNHGKNISIWVNMAISTINLTGLTENSPTSVGGEMNDSKRRMWIHL